MQNVSHRTYSFESFTLDLERASLMRDGQEIKLRPKSFESLKYLIENRGRLVTKDELVKAIWPDSFVTDDSLVQCVRDVRRALEDNSQHYIKTVPRRGYIFEVEVVENGRGTKEAIQTKEAEVPRVPRTEEEPAAERTNASEVGRLGAFQLPLARRLWPWIVAAVLVLAVVGGLAGWYFRPSAPALWRAVPLTSYPGLECNPALSPDGNQVAFTWDGERQDNFDIYIKLIGSGDPLRLTTNPAEDVSPAWSPDGRTIAFLRRLGDDRSELLLIPALGGPQHKLAEARTLAGSLHTGSDPKSKLPSLAWSPDGRWIAISHRERDDLAEGLFLISTRTGEKRRLTQPPLGFRGDFAPAFSPDGRALAFSRLPGFSASEVYLLPLSRDYEPAGEARRLTTDELWAANPVWAQDGRHLLHVFSATISGPSELRMMDVSGSGRSERVPLLADDIRELSFGRHLVYSRSTNDTNIWRAEILPLDGPPSVPRLLISSTQQDFQPRYSPDWRRLHSCPRGLAPASSGLRRQTARIPVN
jgi:DNA-binding winged helix-turn-helix (wHTH) protein/Tol biopolymer transport system component